MPAEIVGHLVRRGFHAGVGCMKKMQLHQQNAPANAQEAMQRLAAKLRSPGAIATFATTAVVFIVLTTLVEYAIRIVAMNLAIVEDTEQPNGAIKLPLGLDDAKNPLMEDYDGTIEERAGQPGKPVTSSLRSTFKHLRSIGGFRSRFRGFVNGIFYSVALSLFNTVFAAVLSPLSIFGLVIARIGSAVLTCNLHAAWTHATIAMPTEKPFFQRFITRKEARHLILPTIRYQLGLLFLQAAGVGSTALAKNIVERHGLNWLTTNAFFLPLIVTIAITLGHVIPSHMALIRAEASLLPEDRSAVVPFDRTFGGRISWEGFATRKAYVFSNISIRGAWMTFDKQTYKRVVKISVKLFMIMLAFFIGFTALFVTEFMLLAGKEAKDAARFGMGPNAFAF